MAYTEPLDITTPADTSPVSQGDDAIRQVKRALVERLGRLVNDVAADPPVLKKSVVVASGAIPEPAGAVGLVRFQSFAGAVPTIVHDESMVIVDPGYEGQTLDDGAIWVGANRRAEFHIALDVPAGGLLTRARVRAIRPHVDCLLQFRVRALSDGVVQDQTAVFTSAGGLAPHWVDSGVFALAIPTTIQMVDMFLTMAGEDNFAVGTLGVELTYNMPA